MFRNMRRFKQELTHDQCVELLESQPRGVMAVKGEDGYPYAFPMDFKYQEGKLYFHCAREGHKLDAIKADNKVSFCVMDQGFKKDGDWALNIKSVIIFGRIRLVTDPNEALPLARAIGQKYYPDPAEVEAELDKAFERVQVLELTIDHMTGKLVNEK